MFNLLIVLLAAYLFYKHGMRYMIKARMMDDLRAQRKAYVFHLVTGMLIGEFFGISISYHYQPEWLEVQVISGTISSILMGELVYFYSKWIVRKIPSVQERKNY